MKLKKFVVGVKARWLVVFVALIGCVDRVEFDVAEAESLIVIDGMISDGPAPYYVKITNSFPLDGQTAQGIAIEKARVVLHDDNGIDEELVEESPGVYRTGGVIVGTIGHTYHITVVTNDGRSYQSIPERMEPVGEVQEIRYEFESRTVAEEHGDVNADVFNIFIDAEAAATSPYVRWRFTGTYQVETYPHLHEVWEPPYTPYKDPLPCSGWKLGEGLGGGLLIEVGPCECCTCWANQYEKMPQLSDGQFISNSEYKNVKVGEVSITPETFNDKYRVLIEQMSLSKEVFDFFKLIREQKRNGSSLFQPLPGEVRGNIISQSSSETVLGVFYATSIRSDVIFIPKSAVPYPLPAMEVIKESCLWFPNSSTTKPSPW